MKNETRTELVLSAGPAGTLLDSVFHLGAEPMKVTVTKPELGRTGWVYFVVVSREQISEEQSYQIQKQHGYMVEGYGQMGFSSKLIGPSEWLSVWKCWNTCD